MITRLRRAWSALETEQRRVALAAGLVLVSLLLPWYTKSTNAIARGGLATQHEAKMALTVPSFVEASIFLVAVAVLVLMVARGERRAFHLPFGDGAVITAAGGWVAFLVFYRFIDQPAGGESKTISYSYDLSWGIFFGLLAAAFLLYAGLRLQRAQVPEPPMPGERPAPDRPETGTAPRSRADEREARREQRRAEREAARAAATEPRPPEPPTQAAPPPPATSVAPARRPQRPQIDGGEQLSFDEQE